MTLQEMLHARVGADPRAAVGVIDVQAGRVRILFGDVGNNRRVVLGVFGNDLSILAPSDLAQPLPIAFEPTEEAFEPFEAANVVFELAGGGSFELRDGLIFAAGGSEALLLVSQADIDAQIASAVTAALAAPAKDAASAEEPPEPEMPAEPEPTTSSETAPTEGTESPAEEPPESKKPARKRPA